MKDSKVGEKVITLFLCAKGERRVMHTLLSASLGPANTAICIQCSECDSTIQRRIELEKVNKTVQN